MASRFVVCATPLVKVYLPEWHKQLLDNPELLQDDKTAFSFSIAHGVSAFRVDYNKPMMVTSGRDDDVESKYQWLIGEAVGSQLETDIYGLVPFETTLDLVQRSDEMAQLTMQITTTQDPQETKAIQKAISKIQSDTAKVLSQVRLNARERSEERIKRAMRFVHNNLVKQWQRNEEMKMGKFPPSMTELFGAHVLDAAIREAQNQGGKMKARMNEIMSSNVLV